MGNLSGHVFHGTAFLFLGLWHLFNHIKLYSSKPNSYISSPWFPTPKIRYLEPIVILVAGSISISAELFISPAKHHPFDIDGTIPSNHLRHFEHSSISLMFIVYALLAILLDSRLSFLESDDLNLEVSDPLHISKPLGYILKDDPDGRPNNLKPNIAALTQLLAAIAFTQEYFLFHMHSTDHHGVEGQYHLFLQYIIFVSLATTLLGIGFPKSFLISFVRSASVLFQGVWLIVTGFMLYIPMLTPKGCLIYNEDRHKLVRCSSHDALSRAKSLVNIQFSWFITGITMFSFYFYFRLVQIYGKRVVYSSLPKEPEDSSDVEYSHKEYKVSDSKSSFILMGDYDILKGEK